MLALKPGLFPLPALRRLLFPHSAFHSGFNSLQTLFLMDFSHGGPPARSGTAPLSKKKISRTPRTQKGGGILFPHFPLLDAPRTKSGWAAPCLPFVGLRAQNPLHPEPPRSLAVSSVSLWQGRGTQGSLSQPCRGGAQRPRRGALGGSGGLHRHPAVVARLGLPWIPLSSFFYPFLTAPPTPQAWPRSPSAPPEPLGPAGSERSLGRKVGDLGCGLPTCPIPLFPRFGFGFSGMGSGPRRGGRGRELSRK